MATVYKKDLIVDLVKTNNYTPDQAAKMINDVFSSIQKNLKKGNTVSVTGFGKFYVNSVKKHRVKSISGDLIDIPKHKVVRFTAGEVLKQNIVKKK